MRKIFCFLFVIIYILTAVLPAAYADFAIFTVNNNKVTELVSGAFRAFAQIDSEAEAQAKVITAVYSDNELTAVDVQSVSLSAGLNSLSSGALSAKSTDTAAKMFVVTETGITPIASPQIITSSRAPAITSASVKIPKGTGTYTCSALVDHIAKTVSFNVMTSVNGGTLSDYSSTPTDAEFDSALTSLSPTFGCTAGSSVEGSGEARDFSKPQVYTLIAPDESKEEYTVTIQRSIGPRGYTFSSSSAYLYTPANISGLYNGEKRLGSLCSNATQYGGGVWHVDGFSYAKSDGEWVLSDGQYVRSDDSTGYLEVTKGSYTKFVKDRPGTFRLYSKEGGTTGLAEKIETQFSLMVDSVSGTGFDVVFGFSELMMRIAPYNDEYCALYFGGKDAIGASEPVHILKLGQRYTAKAIWTSDGKREAACELYINSGSTSNPNKLVTSCTINQPGEVDPKLEHVAFEASGDTQCSVRLYNWKFNYIPLGIPVQVKEGLAQLDTQFDGTLNWLADMYDPVTGGFWMTNSGKAADLTPGIEMTAWGISMLSSYTDLWGSQGANVPEAVKDKFIDFFYDRYDHELGYFVDPADADGKTSPEDAPRDYSRVQTGASRALTALGADNPPPQTVSVLAASPVAALTALADAANDESEEDMPSWMATPETYIDYLESLDWSYSWTAGDNTYETTRFVKAKDAANGNTVYQDALFDWIEANQRKSNGLWEDEIDFVSISGAFKMSNIYRDFGKQMKCADEIIQSVMTAYETCNLDTSYYVRNPISLLSVISTYSPVYKQKVLNAAEAHIADIAASFETFKCADGGFSAYSDKPLEIFGGVVGAEPVSGSTYAKESDLDGTLMMLIARSELYALWGLSVERLTDSDFWSTITAK